MRTPRKMGAFYFKVLKSSEKPSSEVSLMGCGVKPRVCLLCPVPMDMLKGGKQEKAEHENYVVVRALIQHKEYKAAEEEILKREAAVTKSLTLSTSGALFFTLVF